MPLKSVDKPRPSPFEGLEAAAARQPREIVDASPGEGDKASRAAQFLVTGKQQTPIRPPGSVLESLIGDIDRRKQILETDETPWKMICALDLVGANGAQMVGTGWFAGPRTVITAGHCVFDPVELGGWAAEIRVMQGRSGDTMAGDVLAKKFSTTDRWLEAQERDYDYGAIHLDSALGAASGSFGLGVLPDSELTTQRVNVAGYPVTLGNGERQYFHANRIKAVTARRIFYDVDTTPGESGAPVWMYPGSDKTNPVVVGIHAYGIQGTPAGLAMKVNSGPRILPDVLDVTKGWMKKAPPTYFKGCASACSGGASSRTWTDVPCPARTCRSCGAPRRCLRSRVALTATEGSRSACRQGVFVSRPSPAKRGGQVEVDGGDGPYIVIRLVRL